MNSKLITSSLKLILILMLVYGLFELVYSHAAELTVPSDVRTETMILDPQTPAFTPPCACVANEEGRIFYNDKNNDNKLYYCDGTNWKVLNPEKTVATKIVSAYNSVGATRVDGTACLGNGTACSNPKADYTCDGTDDQVKINRAINSLPIDPNGVSYGVVYLLEGTYNISTALEDGDLPASGETVAGIIPHSNTAIIGTGRGTVLKVASGVTGPLSVINASNVNRILISQLMIDGNNQTGNMTLGIFFGPVTYSKIDKVWVEKVRRWGIDIDSASNNNIISNSYVQGCGTINSGISIFASSNNIIFNNSLRGNNNVNIHLNGGSNNIISNNNLQDNPTTGIFIEYSSNNNLISNNNVQGGASEGISIGNSSNNNLISNNNVQGNFRGIVLTASSNSTISNNNVQGNTYDGISLSSSSTNAIVANVIYYDTAGGSGAYDGIKLGSNSDTNIISSNRLYDSKRTGFGINIADNTCDNNYLVGNLIDGTTGTSATGYYNPLASPPYDHRIQDLGTSTKYTDKAKLTFERTQINITAEPYSLYPDSPSPKSYIALNPSIPTTTLVLANGNATGNIVILENITANALTLDRSITPNIRLHTSPLSLNQNDILTLVWNGIDTVWVEIGYSDNSP